MTWQISMPASFDVSYVPSTHPRESTMEADLSKRKQSSFMLWRLGNTSEAPTLVIGQLQLGNPIEIANEQRLPMTQVAGFADLWEVAASACGLVNGQTYHYWFEVSASRPGLPANVRILITDPTATMVDWRIRAAVKPPLGDNDRYPAAVIRFVDGKLAAADVEGVKAESSVSPTSPQLLPTNNRLVIYELPTTWTRSAEVGGRDMGVGTFRDVAAMIVESLTGANFDDLAVTQAGSAYLKKLGINALELLPPADSIYDRQWGYGTTNYSAPDFELGFPTTYAFPAPNAELAKLIKACHDAKIRFFIDVVMAFSQANPYFAADCDEFFILDPKGNPSDPDSHDSRGGFRDGFGATLFRYAKFVNGYDPVSGQSKSLSPARQLMKSALFRWMNDFGVDGIRMDSVENVANWDFIEEYKDLARQIHAARFARGVGADERFLVVGEELNEPHALLDQKRLDGLWHQSFKDYLHMALVGRNHENETTFEWTVRKAIDCRNFGYADMTQAIVYLTSHDVEGFRNERLFNYFTNNGIRGTDDIARRARLAFACLLTSVGVPMILAGDEFADQHDLFDANGNVTQDGGKQVDPVNFSRLSDPWRQALMTYVARLIRFRTQSPALCVNDTEFIHIDFNDGKRVLAWKRGTPGSADIVIVVANFSDFGTQDPLNPSAEYVVSNWPATPVGREWRDISQDRDVDGSKVGRESIFPWEAKVYATV
jgi:pullulanase